MGLPVTWTAANGEPRRGSLTQGDELPPTCDKRFPLVLDEQGSPLTANDLRGIRLRIVARRTPEAERLARAAKEADYDADWR